MDAFYPRRGGDGERLQHPGIWHFRIFNGPTPEALVQGRRAHEVLRVFWNDSRTIRPKNTSLRKTTEKNYHRRLRPHRKMRAGALGPLLCFFHDKLHKDFAQLYETKSRHANQVP